MSENKRYYWIKLKTDFFNQEIIDFMLSQENGFQYVVLYQMLCLQAANNNGELSSKIGEVIIPYDANKIARDTKHFSYDTVLVALDLFKKLGLIYEEEDKILRISDFNEMVGSETKAAQIKRKQRENNVPLIECKRLNNEMLRLPNGNTVFVDEKRYGGNGMLAYDLAGGKCEICGSEENLCIHHNNGYSNDLKDLYILCRKCHSQLENNKEGVEIVHHYVHQEIEYRDNILDIDNKKEIDNNKLLSTKKKNEKFIPPTLEEVEEYCKERNNNVNAKRFFDYYEANNWKDGNNKDVKNWKMKMIANWESNAKPQPKQETEEEWVERMEREIKEKEDNERKRNQRTI